MKRSILALFLAAVLVVSLTACGGGKESDNSAKNADVTVSDKQENGTQSNSTVSVNAAGEQSTGVSAAGESASPAGSGAALSNDAAGALASSAGTASGTSNKPGSNANSGAASGTPSGGNIGGANSSGSSGSSNYSSGSGSGAKPTDPPAKHTHHFVDVGVQALDWSAAQQDNTGPTNTREQVSAVNVCLSCGYFYGNKFEERYIDHILGPNSSKNCTGAYTLVPIYACYHLLECSCGTCKRGKFDHYEYLMYFNGTNNAATKFVLKDWQIQELGLSHA